MHAHLQALQRVHRRRVLPQARPATVMQRDGGTVALCTATPRVPEALAERLQPDKRRRRLAADAAVRRCRRAAMVQVLTVFVFGAILLGLPLFCRSSTFIIIVIVIVIIIILTDQPSPALPAARRGWHPVGWPL